MNNAKLAITRLMTVLLSLVAVCEVRADTLFSEDYSSVEFSGSECRVIRNRPELDFGTEPFTVSVKFKIGPAGKNGSHTLIMKGETVQGVGWTIGYGEWRDEGSGDMQRGIGVQISSEGQGGRNVDVRSASDAVYDGQWHEVKLKRTRNMVLLVVDGKTVASAESPGLGSVKVSNDADMIVGRHASPKDYHVGKIGEVIITCP